MELWRRHNHVYNVANRKIFRNHRQRKIPRNKKSSYVQIYYAQMGLDINGHRIIKESPATYKWRDLTLYSLGGVVMDKDEADAVLNAMDEHLE